MIRWENHGSFDIGFTGSIKMGYNTNFKGLLYFSQYITLDEVVALKKILESCWERKVSFNKKELYIQLVFDKKVDGLEWDGGEKTYDMVDQVNYILSEMWKTYPNFCLNGEFLAQGEDAFDRWKLVIDDNTRLAKKIDIIKDDGEIQCPHCQEIFKIE